MLTERQIKEIKEHLEKAQNPLFFFDNDLDGLCSFLLLQRYIRRGKGVPIKTFPEFDASYFRKVSELNADYIFILDKPVVAEGFWRKVREVNIPVVWIDHHEIQDYVPEFVSYYNPLYSEKLEKKKDTTEAEPVSVLCYQVSNKKDDLWLAVIGAIADKFMPDYYSEFKKKYPDLTLKDEKPSAFDIFYQAEIGKVAKIMDAGLKDKTSNVISMLRFLISAKTPYDVLNESNKNYLMHKRFKQIEKKYQKLFQKALEIYNPKEKVLFFQYGGDLSISAELANELTYRFPDKYIIVMMVKSDIKASISTRGKGIKKIILEAVKNLEDARAGGHESAVGGHIRVDDIEKFKTNIINLLK